MKYGSRDQRARNTVLTVMLASSSLACNMSLTPAPSAPVLNTMDSSSVIAPQVLQPAAAGASVQSQAGGQIGGQVSGQPAPALISRPVPAGAGGAAVTVANAAGTGGSLSSGSPAVPPCAVTKALAANCQACHGTPPIGGAPMSLVTLADFNKPAISKPTQHVSELALARIDDAAAPMPPGGQISAADKQTLRNWFAAGAPPSAANETGCEPGSVIVPPPIADGLVALPGETCYDLPTHGAQTSGDKSPYAIKAGEHYEQFYFKTPWPAGTVATRFGAKFDNLKVLHHWLLFTSAKATSLDGTHETVSGSQLGDTAQLIGGWAVGGKNVEFPPDLGFELPNAQLLNVQWHYYNQSGNAETDASAVQVCTVPATQRKNVASMSFLGTESFNGPFGMPPHQSSDFSGTCTNNSSGPITFWAFWPHMHKLGRHMKSVITRGDGKSEVVFDSAFDFNHQIHYPVSPMPVLQPGESITSTCTFDNNTDDSVTFGSSTDDEMCYQFAFTYPARALDNGVFSLIGATNTCW